jgi:diguanylate cyclase (GGDEF)-like protein
MVGLSQTKPEALYNSRKDLISVSIFSSVQFFLAYFGVSSYASGAIFYSRFSCVSTKNIPGTVNAASTAPIAVLALIIITRYELDPLTLIVAIIMQTLGAAFTPKLVAKMNDKTIHRLLAMGVVLAAIRLLLINDYHIPEDMAVGLRGYKLVIFGLVSAGFGVLNNFGIGSLALTAFTAYAFGLNPLAIVPVMVCAMAVSIPVANMRFIKLGMVSSSVTLVAGIGGATGIWVAEYLFNTMRLDSRILGVVFFLFAFAMLTGYWWKNRKHFIDAIATNVRVSIIGYYIPLATGALIGSEFIFIFYRGLNKLYNAVVRQGIDAAAAFHVKEFIVYYGTGIFIILFFIFLILIGVTRMLKLEIKHHDETKIISLTDPLTGLANRRAFNERLQYEWNRLTREKLPISLLMLDLDRFKNYNDTYGHPQGDELLKALANVVKDFARRPADIAARLGGEEFGILLPGTNLENASHLAEELRLRIEQMKIPLLEGGEPTVTTASIGVAAVVPSSTESCELLVKTADSMLYKAKQSGRNRVCC